MKRKDLYLIIIFFFTFGLIFSACRTDRKQAAPTAVPEVTHPPAAVESPSAPASGSKQTTEKTPTTPEVQEEKPASVETAAPPLKETSTLGLKLKLPAAMHPAGDVIEAYNREGQLLNREIIFRDQEGRELSLKWFAPRSAEAVWNYYLRQFEERKGNFALKAERLTINGRDILYGVSERRFDGKGHPLNPPAKVFFAAWRDGQALYELVYRAPASDKEAEQTFLEILRSVQPAKG